MKRAQTMYYLVVFVNTLRCISNIPVCISRTNGDQGDVTEWQKNVLLILHFFLYYAFHDLSTFPSVFVTFTDLQSLLTELQNLLSSLCVHDCCLFYMTGQWQKRQEFDKVPAPAKKHRKIKVNCFARVPHPTWSWRFRFLQRIILSWKIVPWWLCCIIVFPRDRWVLFQCIWSLLLVFLFVQATITNFLRRLLWRASNLEDYFLHFNFFHSLESPQLTPLIL